MKMSKNASFFAKNRLNFYARECGSFPPPVMMMVPLNFNAREGGGIPLRFLASGLF